MRSHLLLGAEVVVGVTREGGGNRSNMGWGEGRQPPLGGEGVEMVTCQVTVGNVDVVV